MDRLIPAYRFELFILFPPTFGGVHHHRQTVGNGTEILSVVGDTMISGSKVQGSERMHLWRKW